MRVRTVTGKVVEVHPISTLSKPVSELSNDKAKRVLKELGYETAYIVLAINKNNKKVSVYVSKDEFDRVKEYIQQHISRVKNSIFRRQRDSLADPDERYFRKGLEFDWRR